MHPILPYPLDSSFRFLGRPSDAKAGVTSRLTRIMAKGGERIACEGQGRQGKVKKNSAYGWSTYPPRSVHPSVL